MQQARHREKIDIKDMRKLGQPLLVEAAGAIDPGIGDHDIQPAIALQCQLDQARGGIRQLYTVVIGDRVAAFGADLGTHLID